MNKPTHTRRPNIRERLLLAKQADGLMYEDMAQFTKIGLQRLQTIFGTDTGIKANELESLYEYFESSTRYGMWIKSGVTFPKDYEFSPLMKIELAVTLLENSIVSKFEKCIDRNVETNTLKSKYWTKRDIPRLHKLMNEYTLGYQTEFNRCIGAPGYWITRIMKEWSEEVWESESSEFFMVNTLFKPTSKLIGSEAEGRKWSGFYFHDERIPDNESN